MSSGSASKLGRLGIVLAIVVAWACFIRFSGIKGRDGSLPRLEAPVPPVVADFSWTLRDVDDKPIEFSSFRGRPILLNVFATWCEPCMTEMPSIDALAADPRVKAKNVAVVCVSAGESAAAVRRFVTERAYGMTLLRATTIPPAFFTEGIPATFLIAPNGQIKAAQVGAARWDDPSVIAFLEAMK